MADLPEAENYDAGVYQIDITDSVVGGVDGKSNAAARNLANRTKWLKKKVDDLVAGAAAEVTQAEAEAGVVTAVRAWSPLRVRQAVNVVAAAIVNSAPAVLDTLSELATALGNDANFATTITNLISLKAPLASPALTGTPTVPTAAAGTATDQVASTAFVANAIANGAFDYVVRFTTTGNIALTGLGTQGGGDWPAAVNPGDPILVQTQTIGTDNGWYNAAAGAWTRTAFSDTSAEIKSGALTQVTEGSTLADSLWMLTTDGAIALGTTDLSFARKDSRHERQIFPIDAFIAGNNLTVTLAADTPVDFRSSTLNSGAVTTLTNASQLSVTAPSGASFGQISGVKSRIAVVLINDGGTEQLALYNVAGGAHLKEDTLITSTAISAGSVGANVLYSTVAVVTPSPFRLVGYVESTQATPGVWASPLSTVQGAGGLPWAVDSSSFLWLSGHNGYGMTNTTIFRFTSILENSGDAFIYSDSVANGGLITIVKGGLYIAKHEAWPANSGKHGISRNSTELTTAIGSITAANRIAFGGSGAGYPDTVMIAQRLNAGDLIRAHGDASTDLQPTEARFSLIRVGD